MTLVVIYSKEEERAILSLEEWSKRSDNSIYQGKTVTVLRSDIVAAPHFSSSVTQ